MKRSEEILEFVGTKINPIKENKIDDILYESFFFYLFQNYTKQNNNVKRCLLFDIIHICISLYQWSRSYDKNLAVRYVFSKLHVHGHHVPTFNTY